jgi:hypothetical protein
MAPIVQTSKAKIGHLDYVDSLALQKEKKDTINRMKGKLQNGKNYFIIYLMSI